MTTWQKQDDQPLFPDILWSRPEQKAAKAKVLIIGGHYGGFEQVSKAAAFCESFGVGILKVILPDKLAKSFAFANDGFLFVPSTAEGELSLEAQEPIAEQLKSSDVVILPGDLGNNSQTSRVLTDLALKSTKKIVIYGDACKQLYSDINKILSRDNTAFVLEPGYLQQVLDKSTQAIAVTSSTGVIEAAQRLTELTNQIRASIVTQINQKVLAATDQEVVVSSSFPDLLDIACRVAILSAEHQSMDMPTLASACYVPNLN